MTMGSDTEFSNKELRNVLSGIGAYSAGLAVCYIRNVCVCDLRPDAMSRFLYDMERYQKGELPQNELIKATEYLLDSDVLNHIKGSMNARGISDPDGSVEERRIYALNAASK